jgi:hypothetical protein
LGIGCNWTSHVTLQYVTIDPALASEWGEPTHGLCKTTRAGFDLGSPTDIFEALAGPAAQFLYECRIASGYIDYSFRLKKVPLFGYSDAGALISCALPSGCDTDIFYAHQEFSNFYKLLPPELPEVFSPLFAPTPEAQLRSLIALTIRDLASRTLWSQVHAVAQALLAKQTLSGAEVNNIIAAAPRMPRHDMTSIQLIQPWLNSNALGLLCMESSFTPGPSHSLAPEASPNEWEQRA